MGSDRIDFIRFELSVLAPKLSPWSSSRKPLGLTNPFELILMHHWLNVHQVSFVARFAKSALGPSRKFGESPRPAAVAANQTFIYSSLRSGLYRSRPVKLTCPRTLHMTSVAVLANKDGIRMARCMGLAERTRRQTQSFRLTPKTSSFFAKESPRLAALAAVSTAV
jgi:hypothetical protein